MGNRSKKASEWKQAAEKRGNHTFFPLRHDVSRSPVYLELPSGASKLLRYLIAQYTGDNNGDLSASFSQTGFKSHETLNKAKKDLLESGLAVVSRQGGRNQCTLYALTFLAIDECGGKLDISPTRKPPDNWKKKHYEMTPPPALKPSDAA